MKEFRVGLIGSGVIGSYVLEQIHAGKAPGIKVAVVLLRNEQSRGTEEIKNYGIPITFEPLDLLEYDLDIVIENASQQALAQYAEMVLSAGISLMPMSLGAFVEPSLLERLIKIAEEGDSRIIIPSGGIGGLDALAAAMVPGLKKVEMVSRKAPIAWKNIEYIEEMGWELDDITEPFLLFDGPAIDCVQKFPQNINIAAALSLATMGFEETNIKIYADPWVELNTHKIVAEGQTGRLTFLFENTPVPANPKTTYLAAASVVAALRRQASHYTVGT